jgi:hypothetical protein
MDSQTFLADRGFKMEFLTSLAFQNDAKTLVYERKGIGQSQFDSIWLRGSGLRAAFERICLK